MKSSHLLLIAATSLAPLQAATPQENIASALAATLQAPKGAQDQSLSAALAPIPAGYDFFCLYNVDQLGQSLAQAGLIDEEDATDTPFTSITLATNYAETASTMKGIYQLYNKLVALGTLNSSWVDAANEQYEDALDKALDPDSLIDNPEAIAKIAKACEEMEIAPFYLTIELTEASVPNVMQLFMQLPMFLADAPEGVSCEMEGSKAIVTVSFSAILDDDSTVPEPIKEGLSDKKLSITLELKGASLQVAVGTNRDSLKWAESAEQSVLANSAAEFLKNPAEGKGFLCASMSKQALNAYRSTADYAELLATVFTKLGKVVPENQATFDAAAKSIVQLSRALDAVAEPIGQDLQVTAWFDKGFFAEISCDFMGNYSPAKMAGLASINEQTAFIMQSGKFDYKKYHFEPLLKALPHVVPVLDAVGLTLSPDMQEELLALEVAKNLIANPTELPDEVSTVIATAQSTVPSIIAMADSLGDSYGLSCSVNADPEADEVLVAFAELRNKSQFLEGFAKTYETINAAAAKYGVAIPPLDIAIAQDGPVTSYTLVEDGITMQASLGEQCISISNVPSANASMQQSMSSGNGPTIAGAIIYVNLENTASILDKYEILEDDEYCADIPEPLYTSDSDEEVDEVIVNSVKKENSKTDVGPFRDLIITGQNLEPNSTKGVFRLAMPLK